MMVNIIVFPSFNILTEFNFAVELRKIFREVREVPFYSYFTKEYLTQVTTAVIKQIFVMSHIVIDFFSSFLKLIDKSNFLL